MKKLLAVAGLSLASLGIGSSVGAQYAGAPITGSVENCAAPEFASEIVTFTVDLEGFLFSQPTIYVYGPGNQLLQTEQPPFVLIDANTIGGQFTLDEQAAALDGVTIVIGVNTRFTPPLLLEIPDECVDAGGPTTTTTTTVASGGGEETTTTAAAVFPPTGPGRGGSLPRTGSEIDTILQTAALLLVGGMLVVVAVRRRNTASPSTA